MPELTDSITDAIYFAGIERRKSLVTIENSVLYAMSVFLFIAIIKDVICTFLTVRQYRVSKNMHRGNLAEVTETDRPMTHPELAQLKTYKFTFCCLMEDFVQCNLQFFYIEKFLLEEDLFIYINSAIMIIIYLWFGGQLVVLLINNRQMQRVKKYYIVGQGVFAAIYPCSRLIGSIHQMTRGEAKIVGACVQYNYIERTLKAVPFRTGCLIGNDYVLLLSSCLTCLGAFGLAFILQVLDMHSVGNKLVSAASSLGNSLKRKTKVNRVASEIPRTARETHRQEMKSVERRGRFISSHI